jgi:hypothetical protein
MEGEAACYRRFVGTAFLKGGSRFILASRIKGPHLHDVSIDWPILHLTKE